MAVTVIIPARYDSTRFPGKPIYPLKGKPLIQYTYENAKGSKLANDIIVATDHEVIYNTVLSFGGKAVMTDKKHPSGTDRIAEVAHSLACDIIVNVQADEPLIRPEMIDNVVSLLDDQRAAMGSLVKKIEEADDIMDPNLVKAVFDQEGFALYFSRAPIPFHRDGWKIQCTEKEDASPDFSQYVLKTKVPHLTTHSVFKHIGIYSYRKDVLLALSRMKPTELEEIEKLEQLRALENGIKIKLKETLFETFGVDTPADLERVEKCLNISS